MDGRETLARIKRNINIKSKHSNGYVLTPGTRARSLFHVDSMLRPTFRTSVSNGKPPTVKISQISTTIYPIRNNCISLIDKKFSCQKPRPNSIYGCASFATGRLFTRHAYLLPTAAFFLSDLHIRKRVTNIDIKASRIDPGIMSVCHRLSHYFPDRTTSLSYLDFADIYHRLGQCHEARILHTPSMEIYYLEQEAEKISASVRSIPLSVR